MFSFTASQIDEFVALAGSTSSERPYADFYDAVASLIQGIPGLEVEYAWFCGARDVNRGQGPWSDFIRAYTQKQIEIRTGNPLADPAVFLNKASDAIARNVLDSIVNSGHLPSLHEIGEQDANSTVSDLASSVPGFESGSLAVVSSRKA